MNSEDIQKAPLAIRLSDRRVTDRVSKILDRVVFAGLLVTIVLTAIPYGTVQPWWEAAFESAIFVLSGLWLLKGLLRAESSHLSWRLFAPMLALILLAYLQTLPFRDGGPAGDDLSNLRSPISADPYETKLFIFKVSALTLAGLLLSRHTLTERRLRLLVHVVIGVAVASALFGIIRLAAQHSPGFFLAYLGVNTDVTGQFINRNHFAYLMEMGLGLVLGLIFASGLKRERLALYIGAAIFVWIALVLSNSRGGILSMLFEIALLVLAFKARRAPASHSAHGRAVASGFKRFAASWGARVLLGMFLLLVTVVGIVKIGGDPVVNRLGAITNEGNEETSPGHTARLDIWRATVRLIKAHPLVGVGFGGFEAAFPQYHEASGVTSAEAAHNEYLEVMASGGLIGTALVAWFVIAFLILVARRSPIMNPFRRAVWLGGLIGLSGVAVHSFTDFGLHVTINALVFVALIVMVINSADNEAPSQARRSLRPVARSVVMTASMAALVACFFGMQWSATAGASRLFSTAGLAAKQLPALDQSVSLTPSDPEAHHDRAQLLSDLNRQPAAVAEYETAVKLRPRDYRLWLDLGMARDTAGDEIGSLSAFKNSINLAPYYAQPHFQLGNLLFRMGRTDEGFAELREAVSRDPIFLSNNLDLAWAASAGNVQVFEEWVQPQTPSARLELAHWLVRHENAAEAVKQIHAAGNPEGENQRLRIKLMISELINSKHYPEAYEVWAMTHATAVSANGGRIDQLINGGFEDQISRNDPGFGWQLISEQNSLQAALDPAERHSGKYSLRLDYHGEMNPQTTVLSQLVIVRPNSHYALHFVSKAQDLVSGALPQIAVFDVSSKQSRLLGESRPISPGSGEWGDYRVDFNTDQSQAILISLQRQNCASSACPIFGKIWLDDFHLDGQQSDTRG